MGRASFSQVVDELRSFGAPTDEDAYQAVEKLEQAILDHCPRSPEEAAAMLEVVIPAVSAGGRSDGRDVEALQRIQTLLAQAQA